jgi:hypothetical protein
MHRSHREVPLQPPSMGSRPQMASHTAALRHGYIRALYSRFWTRQDIYPLFLSATVGSISLAGVSVDIADYHSHYWRLYK